MKYYDVRRAYLSLIKIGGMQLNAKTAYGIYLLMSKLSKAFEHILTEERKILEDNGGELLDDGSVFFKTNGDDDEAKADAHRRANSFQTAINELNMTNADIEIEKIAIGMDELADVKLSASEIASLSYLIDFSGGAA